MSMEEKWIKMSDLYLQVSDPMFDRFFDLNSENMLDEKIQVLTALVEGKVPTDIPDYYKVFELLPPDDQHWDI